MMPPDSAPPAAPSATESAFHASKQSSYTTLKHAADELNQNEPSTSAREFFVHCADLERRIDAFINLPTPTCSGVNGTALQRTQAQTKKSLEVIGDALERYSLDHLALSYNGGKDCLVLLVLYLAALPRFFTSQEPLPPVNHMSTSNVHSNTFQLVPSHFPSSLPAVYIEAPNPFAEVDSFVAMSSKSYHLSLARQGGAQGMRSAFTAYLAQNSQIQAILVGTRRSDPHGASLHAFQATDRGWPAFMRVHPVLEWRYEDIWVFLREVRVPYCDLYDQGYTSLGGRLDTHPNPALRRINEAGDVVYGPAYELEGDEAERLGRRNYE